MKWPVRCFVIVVALHGAAVADTFDPPASVPDAQDRYLHAKSLFAAKRFAEAATEFADAYRLDPGAKFLLFDIALAQRMAGACNDAIASYRAFLAAHPPEQYTAAAQVGIDRCEHATPATAATPALDTPPSVPTAAAPTLSAVMTEPLPSRSTVRPWYRDGLGDGLVLAGAAAGITSGILYVLARNAASDTFSAHSLPAYNSSRDTATTDQTASWIAASAGAALIAAGAVRYVTRPSPTIAIAPARGGAVAVLGGWF